jgi:hypothetical protein
MGFPVLGLWRRNNDDATFLEGAPLLAVRRQWSARASHRAAHAAESVTIPPVVAALHPLKGVEDLPLLGAECGIEGAQGFGAALLHGFMRGLPAGHLIEPLGRGHGRGSLAMLAHLAGALGPAVRLQERGEGRFLVGPQMQDDAQVGGALALVSLVHLPHPRAHLVGRRLLAARVVLGPSGGRRDGGRAQRGEGRKGGLAEDGSHLEFS